MKYILKFINLLFKIKKRINLPQPGIEYLLTVVVIFFRC